MKTKIKRFFRGNNKQYCIVQNCGNVKFYWEGGFMWYVDRKDKAKLGTRREMEIILNHELYQYRIRGARVEKI